MSEFENIQRLMRLKRYEQPGEEFAEEFLREFQHRQRAEMLKRSSVELFLERVGTWWANLMMPKWSIAATAAAACVAGVWMFTGSKTAPTMADAPAAPVPVVVPEKPFIPKLDLSDLPMANMADRGNTKLEEALIRKHLEMSPILESGVSPLPASAKGFEQIPSGKPTGDNGTEGLGK